MTVIDFPLVDRARTRASEVGCYVDEISETERGPEDTGPYLLRCAVTGFDLHPGALPITGVMRIIGCVVRERLGEDVPLDDWLSQ